MRVIVKFSDGLCADQLRLDKEDDGGPWVLSYGPLPDGQFLRLCVTTGGPWDWHSFTAQVQASGQVPILLGSFDVSPAELYPREAAREIPPDVERWNPSDEPDFLRVPSLYRATLAAMVRYWGRVVGTLVPAPAWRTIH